MSEFDSMSFKMMDTQMRVASASQRRQRARVSNVSFISPKNPKWAECLRQSFPTAKRESALRNIVSQSAIAEKARQTKAVSGGSAMCAKRRDVPSGRMRSSLLIDEL